MERSEILEAMNDEYFLSLPLDDSAPSLVCVRRPARRRRPSIELDWETVKPMLADDIFGLHVYKGAAPAPPAALPSDAGEFLNPNLAETVSAQEGVSRNVFREPTNFRLVTPFSEDGVLGSVELGLDGSKADFIARIQ